MRGVPVHRHPPSIPTPAMFSTLERMAREKRTQHEIAGELRVAQGTIGRWLKRYGLPSMTRAEGRATSVGRLP